MTVKSFCLYEIKIDVRGYCMLFYIPDDSLGVRMTQFVRPGMLLRRTHGLAAMIFEISIEEASSYRSMVIAIVVHPCVSFLKLAWSIWSFPQAFLVDFVISLN